MSLTTSNSETLAAPTDEPSTGLLRRVWSAIHPSPTLPLTEDFEAGLGPLLQGLGEEVGGVFTGRRARWVMDRIGDRYAVTVTPDEIHSRGFLRSTHVPWEQVEVVVLQTMTSMAAKRVLAWSAHKVVGRMVPIPGLRWIAHKVASLVVDASTGLAVNVADQVVTDPPRIVSEIRNSRGRDIVLEGPLAMTSLLSRGLTAVVLAQADRHDIPVQLERD